MVDEQWFRNRKWNRTEEEKFFKRLARFRRLPRKAAILRIKACSLYETKKEALIRAAIRLLKHAEELRAAYEMALCYYYLAKSYEWLHEKSNALIYFEKCIDHQRNDPKVIMTKSHAEYAEFIVQNKLTDLYYKALGLISSLSGKYRSPDDPCYTPFDNFLYFGIKALVYTDPHFPGKNLEYARKMATNALRYVGKKERGVVNPSYGKVLNHWMIKELRAIAPYAAQEIQRREKEQKRKILQRDREIKHAEIIVKQGHVGEYDTARTLLLNNLRIEAIDALPTTFDEFLYYGSVAVMYDDIRSSDWDSTYAQKAAKKAVRCLSIPKNHWLLHRLKQIVCAERKLFYLNSVKKQLHRSTIDFSKMVGCTEMEIHRLEKRFVIGAWKENMRFPPAYKEFLLWMGKHGGGFMKGTDCFYTSLGKNNDYAQELLEENKFPQKLPYDAFVFSMHQGYIFHFFRTVFFRKEEERNDPPVYVYVEGQKEGMFRCAAPRFSRYLVLMAKQTAHMQPRKIKR